MNATITAPAIELKSAIIGKMWINKSNPVIVPQSVTLPTETSFSANQSFLVGALSFRTDRNLTPVTVKAGEKLFFYANNKRPDRQDPDYSVSVRLPKAEAEAVIANSQKGVQDWKASQQA